MFCSLILDEFQFSTVLTVLSQVGHTVLRWDATYSGRTTFKSRLLALGNDIKLPDDSASTPHPPCAILSLTVDPKILGGFLPLRAHAPHHSPYCRHMGTVFYALTYRFLLGVSQVLHKSSFLHLEYSSSSIFPKLMPPPDSHFWPPYIN